MRGRARSQRRRRAPRALGIGPQRRLTRHADFERLLREGTRRTASGYTFYFSRRAEGELPRLGVLVSRKHAAAATVRNRIKRCIREAFRVEQHHLRALDLLVRPAYGAKPGPEMIARLRALFARFER